MRKNSFIQGALILTVAGIIVKFIGAFSRIYLSRLLGGEGIGLYQMAYPIYLLCLSVSSAGLPVAISIMVAERNAVNDYFGGQKDSNPRHLVLETNALPAELYPCITASHLGGITPSKLNTNLAILE